MDDRRGILFLCVANSARSQMAEALARHLAPDGTRIYSAGSSPGRVHPFAVRVIEECGLTMEGHYSKPLESVPSERIGTVITLCAEQVCPVYFGDVERLHWPFEDPTSTGGSDEAVLASFRRVRDGIAERLEAFFGNTDRSAG